MKQNSTLIPKPGLIKKLFQNRLYATLILILLLCFSVLSVFLNSSMEKLFRENYLPYEVRVTRGISGSSPLKEEYKKGNKDSVIWEFNTLNSPQPEEFLLAGIAFLESNQTAKAIKTFNALIEKNALANSDYFEEDAEYYLAMSYLKNQEFEKALPIFEKIQADPEHPYNSTVSDWFLLQMKTSIAKK